MITLDRETETKKTNETSFADTLIEWLDSLVISFLAVVVIFTFFLGKVKVDGESMRETLQDKDQLLISDFLYKPDRGDIVIISRNPENKDTEKEQSSLVQEPLVKRVIAVAGDTIEITADGDVLLNDEEIDEPYIKDYVDDLGTPQNDLKIKLEVPEGRIFVMGDNRWNSHDSRKTDIWLVDERYVLGKVIMRVYPFDKLEIF